MTDERKSRYMALNGYQEQRAEAVLVAREVLSAKQVFGSPAPPAERAVQDILTLAEYIVGDRDTDFPRNEIAGYALPIPSDAVPGIFSALGDVLPDCGHPECPIHTPRREAQAAEPDDAKSSFDHPSSQTAPESEDGSVGPVFIGGPLLPAADRSLGYRMQVDGAIWEVALGFADRHFWRKLGPVQREWTDTPMLPNPEYFSVGDIYSDGYEYKWVAVAREDGNKYWAPSEEN